MRARAALVALLTAGLLASCLGLRPGPPPSTCTHLKTTREARGVALCEDVWTCSRPPGGRFDRVGLHRLAACEGATGPVLLYLPGMHMNGDLVSTDARYDLRLYLATTGVRTWGLDYRTHAVPDTASTTDLETLGRWTAELFADDVEWAVGFARGADPGPVYLAGFSFGAGLAYRVASRADVTGLVILDGAAGAGRPAGGEGPAIDVGGSRLPFAERQRLLDAVIADPAGPSPQPGFPTAGDALAEILYSAPSFGGKGGLADARRASDVRVLAMMLRRYDRWWPRAALAGTEPRPPRSPLPLIAFASTNMGPEWVARVRASAEAFGGKSARVGELPGRGHLDVLVGRSAARDVFEPVRHWLEDRSVP
jgi:hypothetical protein